MTVRRTFPQHFGPKNLAGPLCKAKGDTLHHLWFHHSCMSETVVEEEKMQSAMVPDGVPSWRGPLSAMLSGLSLDGIGVSIFENMGG